MILGSLANSRQFRDYLHIRAFRWAGTMASATARVNCMRCELRACTGRCWSDISALVREDILLHPSLYIQAGAVWNEAETGLRQVTTAFASQHCVELLAQPM
jgi:hypothetical protein